MDSATRVQTTDPWWLQRVETIAADPSERERVSKAEIRLLLRLTKRHAARAEAQATAPERRLRQAQVAAVEYKMKIARRRARRASRARSKK